LRIDRESLRKENWGGGRVDEETKLSKKSEKNNKRKHAQKRHAQKKTCTKENMHKRKQKDM